MMFHNGVAVCFTLLSLSCRCAVMQLVILLSFDHSKSMATPYGKESLNFKSKGIISVRDSFGSLAHC